MTNISKSKFFNFKKTESNKEYNVYYFKVWSNIIIFRIDFLKKTFNRDFLSIIKNKKNLLAANKLSVDIGPYDFLGGKSHGAVGFDFFFPKRKEKRYLQK